MKIHVNVIPSPAKTSDGTQAAINRVIIELRKLDGMTSTSRLAAKVVADFRQRNEIS